MFNNNPSGRDNIFLGNSGIFSGNSQYSNSQGNNLDLNQMYANLERLKQEQISGNQNVGQKTVFTEIAEEFNNLSDSEQEFIQNSTDYIKANQDYQTQFSAFLIEKFGQDFSASKYGKAAENMLAVIRNKKDEYKNKFAENINEIKENNKILISKNDELAKINENLQKQLSNIQEQLRRVD